MTQVDFEHYWRVAGGITGDNGALIELRYDRGKERTLKTLTQLETLVDELKALDSESVLQSPRLISQLWRMPEWVLSQYIRWGKQGYDKGLSERLSLFRLNLLSEIRRLLGSPINEKPQDAGE